VINNYVIEGTWLQVHCWGRSAGIAGDGAVDNRAQTARHDLPLAENSRLESALGANELASMDFPALSPDP
jgi:hypothetical protein